MVFPARLPAEAYEGRSARVPCREAAKARNRSFASDDDMNEDVVLALSNV